MPQFNPPPLQPRQSPGEALAGPALQSLANLPNTILAYQQYKLLKAKSDLEHKKLLAEHGQFDMNNRPLQYPTNAAQLPGVNATNPAEAQTIGGLTPPATPTETPSELVGRVGTEGAKAYADIMKSQQKPVQSTYFFDETTKKSYDSTGSEVASIPPGSKMVVIGKKPGGAGMSASAQNTDAQLANINKLEKLLENVDTGIGGFAQKLKGKLTGGALNPSAKTYNDFRDAIAVGLYRAVTGDTRISDQDVGRARSILPDPYDSKQVRENKLTFIKDALKEKTSGLPSGAIPSVGELFDGHKVKTIKRVE